MTDGELIREIARDLTHTFERLAPATGNDWLRLIRLTARAAMGIGSLIMERQARLEADSVQARWN